MTGFTGRRVRLVSGLELKPDLSFEHLPAPDLLLLPAIWRNPLPTIKASRPWLDRIKEMAASGSRICSVGTASCLLAEAGMLKGKPATTHWNYFKHFARRYPDVKLKTSHLITQCDNIYCVGSVNAVADLMVHIVEEWLGSRIARAVENQFSPEIRQSFRAAAFQDVPNRSHHDETVVEGQQWIQDNLGDSISIKSLAHHLDQNLRYAKPITQKVEVRHGAGGEAFFFGNRRLTARFVLR